MTKVCPDEAAVSAIAASRGQDIGSAQTNQYYLEKPIGYPAQP